MINQADLIGFIGIILLAYAIPGPDLLMVSKHAKRRLLLGEVTGLGAQAGLCIHLIIAAFGIAAVYSSSPYFFSIIKLCGAAYLILMGVVAIKTSLKRKSKGNEFDSDFYDKKNASALRAFRDGFLTNLFNPKAILFFASVLPQFLDRNDNIREQIIILGIVDVVIGVFYWIFISKLVNKISKWLSRPHVDAWWNRITGGLLITYGLFLARV